MIIWIAGPPGCGKTQCSRMIEDHYAAQGKTVYIHDEGEALVLSAPPADEIHIYVSQDKRPTAIYPMLKRLNRGN